MPKERVVIPEERHLGRVSVSEEIILAWLKFQGGHLETVKFTPYGGKMELTIEHPEMPLIGIGDEVPDIDPEYTIFHDPDGDILGVTRKSLKEK